jgi:acetylornithine/succinyldiaminopimelate/putrescine aminotransferase
VFFCNSGAEANEAAIKLARKWGGPGKYAVISAYNSFHGRTLATLHATGQPAKHEPFQPLPDGFRHVAWDDLDALEKAIDPSVAAILLEPVQGEGGVQPATPEYFQAVRKLCDERGLLFIVDEVQTGLGNGMPIGACWAKAEVAEAFKPGDHATTFGGQPLATSAARAVLKVMETENAPAKAERAGKRLVDAIELLPGVKNVRGMGLLIAVELDAGNAGDVAARALDAGLVVNPVTASALRLAPSLLVSDDEIDEAVTILAKVLSS